MSARETGGQRPPPPRHPAGRRRDARARSRSATCSSGSGRSSRPSAATSSGPAGSSSSPASLDMLDGRVARLSNTGTRFGAELDSLVDVISFGVAPAMIMYFLEFAEAGQIRLGALLHLRRGGRGPAGAVQHHRRRQADKPGWFTGLPSPAAGMTLAVVLPVQPDRVVPEVSRLPRPPAPGTDLPDAGAARALMVSTVKYPRTAADRLPRAERLIGHADHARHPGRRSSLAPLALPVPLRHRLPALRHRPRSASHRARPERAEDPVRGARPCTLRPTPPRTTTITRIRRHDLSRSHPRGAPGRPARPAGPGRRARAGGARVRRRRRRPRRPGHRARHRRREPPAAARRGPRRCATSCSPTR